MRNFLNMDSNTSLFLQRELQAIETRTYTVPGPPLKAERLIPVDTSIPAGAQQWGFDRYTEVGSARWASSNPRDMPRVRKVKARSLFPMATLWDGYAYTWDDVQQAMMAGMEGGLDASYAMTARNVLERYRNRVWLRGAPEKGFVGLFSDPLVPIVTASVGDWDGTGASTPAQILEAAHRAVLEVTLNNEETSEPDTMALPLQVYGYWSTTPLGVEGGGPTILASFLANSPSIRTVEAVNDLRSAGVGGVGRAMIYRKDPAVLEAKASVLFLQLPPQLYGLETQVPCLSKIGGVAIKEPVNCIYVDGVMDAAA